MLRPLLIAPLLATGALVATPTLAQTARDDPAAAAQRDLSLQRQPAPPRTTQAPSPPVGEASRSSATEGVVPQPTERARYEGCTNAIATAPQAAETYAQDWRARGGGLPARHCLAMAQIALGKFAPAAATLDAAARAAEAERSPLAADFHAQAGNAALLAENPRAAITHFNAALALDPPAPQAAAIRVDRARAAVEAGELRLARSDLDAATTANPADPAGWLLSAALARREQDLARADRDIARAAAIDPRNPDVVLEAANISLATGDRATARRGWAAVVRIAPGSPAADLAAKALAANP